MSAWARRDELFVIWAAARAEANVAYEAWCTDRTRDGYAVYRAFEDQADAAEADLAAVTEVLLSVA
jgi:hypothetical protein